MLIVSTVPFQPYFCQPNGGQINNGNEAFIVLKDINKPMSTLRCIIARTHARCRAGRPLRFFSTNNTISPELQSDRQLEASGDLKFSISGR
jgi:hypothetical protein